MPYPMDVEKKKSLTLLQFVKACGSIEAAAAQAGVSGSTFWRWIHTKSKPHGNNARWLHELGVDAKRGDHVQKMAYIKEPGTAKIESEKGVK